MDRNKPKLLVVLGAGSSIPCEMPSVAEIDKLMGSWSQGRAPEGSVDSESDVFNILWQASKCYYGTNHYGIGPNYERVLGDMTMLASWLSSPPFGIPLIGAVKDGRPVGELESLLSRSNEHAARIRVLNQHTFLLERLASYMRERSRNFDPKSPAFGHYKKFFMKLRDQFHLGIYNLNYDIVVRTAWPEAFNGFDCWGRFDPLCVSQRQDWGFIYHLHGSVHHSICHEVARPWIVWKKDLAEEFSDHGIPQIDMAQDFKSIPLTTLITGGSKLDQLLAEPYQTFYSTLVRHVHEADAILIAGYGFGDLHVNRVLRNRFEGHDDHKPYPRVIILEKSCSQRPRTGRLEINRFWPWELTHTLKTRFSDGSKLSLQDHRTVAEFIEQENFETDNKDRVAIWHGGFLEALSAVNKIAEWLLQ